MKTELTEERIKTLVQAAYQWGRDNSKGRSDKNLNDFYQTRLYKEKLSLLTKQEEQPQANDADCFLSIEKSYGEMINIKYLKEIQALKQANAELKDALSEVMQVVNEEEEFDPDHVKKWNKILSKHDKK